MEKEGIHKELLNKIYKIQKDYNKSNIEMANLLHGIAEHFAWYETHGKNNIND